jgi:pimeloyl-ACP methyl ester carboxylesterase
MSNHKIPLLLLHGALGSSKSFDHLMSGLEDRFSLIRPDLPGHGDQGLLNGVNSVQELSAFLSDFMLENQLKNIPVFGYSLGGYLAIYHEWLHPGSFSAIVTLGTKLAWNQEFAKKQEIQLHPNQLILKAREYYDSLVEIHGPNTDNLLLCVIELMKKLGEFPLIQSSVMNDLKIPVLLAVGELDRMVSLEETTKFSELNKYLKVIGLPNTYHPLEKLSKEAFLSLIDFFNEKKV